MSVLTMSEAVRVSGRSEKTLVRHTDNGSLPCTRSPGGHRRFALEDLYARYNLGRNSMDNSIAALKRPTDYADKIAEDAIEGVLFTSRGETLISRSELHELLAGTARRVYSLSSGVAA